MMRYAIKRLLYIVPTIGMIMLIMFVLSKVNHDDPAEVLCQLEGISYDHPNQAIEYAKHYKALGLSKPNFYLSIQPSFYHPSINTVVDKHLRTQILKLSSQRIEYRHASNYIHTRDSLIKYSLADTTLRPKHRHIQKMEFLTDLAAISESVDSFPMHSHWHLITNQLMQGRVGFYIPRLIWHGMDNQFHRWASSFVRGDLGVSLQDGQPIGTKVAYALKWTLLLLIISLVISTTISVWVGSWSGYYTDGWIDKISSTVWLILYSIPVFWLASMLILYCTSDRYGMPIFPSPDNWSIDHGRSFLPQVFATGQLLILPIICMVANDLAYFTRMTRNNIIAQKDSLYSKIATVRGIKSSIVLWRYLVPNSMVAMITILIGLVPAGISGSLVIEIVFNIPGMGRLMYDSISHADWPTVYCIVMIISIVTISLMALGDIIYIWINPKIKVDE
jgi:peptide/nickel transport system permease protein